MDCITCTGSLERRVRDDVGPEPLGLRAAEQVRPFAYMT